MHTAGKDIVCHLTNGNRVNSINTVMSCLPVLFCCLFSSVVKCILFKTTAQ